VAEVTGDARVRVERGALVVAPTAVTVAGGSANGALIRELAPRLSLRYPVRGLPPGATLEALGVTSTGFRVRVVADDVELVR
jgi:hypothetical protein